MRLTTITTLAVMAALALPTTGHADGADVTGTARCETDGSWSVDWTITAPSRGGLWSVLPGMYQDPLPWQPDTEPFHTTTTGQINQPDAQHVFIYGWQDGPTGQSVVGIVLDPHCATPSIVSVPVAESPAVAAPPTPQLTAEPIVEPVTASWLTPTELALADLRGCR